MRAAAGCLTDLPSSYRIADTGFSFHARHPLAALDRIICDSAITIESAGVHMSAAARKASDHLPLVADFCLK